jgi:alpha-tubulin suppressor-like RCC1 family protein
MGGLCPLLFVLVAMTAASVAQSSPLASPLPAICWGQGSYNQLAVPTGSQFIEIAAGYQHTCALDSSRAALCWGSHGRGEDAIAATGGWADLAAGFYATCGLVESPNSTVRCFGFNSKNQTSSLPSGLQFRQFSFRIEFGCGLVSGADVGVLCWGEDSYGRVSAAPTAGNFTRVATGAYHACALRPNATAVCWGNDDSGQIELPAGAQFAQLCCGHQWTCGLDRDTGAPRCWGSQTYPVVVNAPSSASFDSLTCGWLHACGRMANGTVRCWGVSSAGALAVPSGYAFEQISAGYQFTCGLYRPVPSAVAPVVSFEMK